MKSSYISTKWKRQLISLGKHSELKEACKVRDHVLLFHPLCKQNLHQIECRLHTSLSKFHIWSYRIYSFSTLTYVNFTPNYAEFTQTYVEFTPTCTESTNYGIILITVGCRQSSQCSAMYDSLLLLKSIQVTQWKSNLRVHSPYLQWCYTNCQLHWNSQDSCFLPDTWWL